MGEQELPRSKAPTEFGQPVAKDRKRADLITASQMFTGGEELPLFSGSSIPTVERPFVPEDHSMKQGMLPGMPDIDYDHVLEKDKALRRRGHNGARLPPSGDLFVALPSDAPPQPEASTPLPEPVLDEPATIATEKRPRRKRVTPGATEEQQLREALAPYLDYPQVRQLAAVGALRADALRCPLPRR